ncbi:MAG TPA: transposase [Chthoniobacterales bacterium]|nr:transposase [Chthoniobacterales bacterium]
MNRFGRRPPRLVRIHQAVDAPVWFITFCTHRRQKWLASDPVHTAFVRFAERAARDFNVAVGRYIIMPDHVHFFVCGDQHFVLANWIGALKQALAKAAHRSKSAGQIWQEGFFDHLLRSDESMSQKWDYIRENALHAGLVERAEDWPHQGEIIPIDRA